jgi:hypothetical protein
MKMNKVEKKKKGGKKMNINLMLWHVHTCYFSGNTHSLIPGSLRQ